MTETRIALLPDRGVVSVTGDDAWKLLQGVTTNDMALLRTQAAVHSALLSPQGKILFEFFVVQCPGGFCLETARERAPALAERLLLYRLRARADIKDASADYTVAAIWGGSYAPRGAGQQPLWFSDPRLPDMGYRELVTIRSDWALAGEQADCATQEDFHAHRIGLGVPEGGKDYEFGDTFPHEASFDQLQGLSFTKGCYVGQEVVSRMQNRANVRKRIVQVKALTPLPAPGTAISAGGIEIGSLGSVAGDSGLALVRLDRAAEFAAKGESLYADTVPLRIAIPSWADFSLAPHAMGSPA
jgi:folate-binding protein YgfZ